MKDLQGHPVACSSWEGFVVEQVAAALPADVRMGFCRTAAGAEIDLVIEHRSRKIAVGIRFSSAPEPARGFWQALGDLKFDRAYLVAPVPSRYRLADGVEVVPVGEVAAWLAH